MKKLLGCLMAAVGVGIAACWMQKTRSEEETFRDLLRGLTIGPDPEEVLRQIAERARKLVGGTAAYVERIDFERDEIVAAAVSDGEHLPVAGARGPYTGSVAQLAIRKGTAIILRDVSESRSILASIK